MSSYQESQSGSPWGQVPPAAPSGQPPAAPPAPAAPQPPAPAGPQPAAQQPAAAPSAERAGAEEEIGLSEAARNRLGQTTTGSMMSSSDYLLLDEAGLESIGAVTGVSVVHLGEISLAGIQAPSELEGYSRALTAGWTNALRRVVLEADALGADGVFLQRGDMRHFDGEEYEYHCQGTALRLRERPGALRTPAGLPFLTYARAMALYQFLRRGLCPVTYRITSCAYYVPHRTLRITSGQSYRHAEDPVLTDGWHTGREIALARLQAGLAEAGSEVTMGMWVDVRPGLFGEHTAELQAYGRGWRRIPDLAELIPEVDLAGPALIERDSIQTFVTMPGARPETSTDAAAATTPTGH